MRLSSADIGLDFVEIHYSEHPCEHRRENGRVDQALATASTPGECMCEGPVEDCGIPIAVSTHESAGAKARRGFPRVLGPCSQGRLS